MIYRENTRNGDKISQLAFGCMRLPRKGPGIDISRAGAMIRSAIEQGVNYFDTAYIYPGSEAALGQILQGDLRKKVYLATKMPTFLTKTAADIPKYFAVSLERLRTDYIDYYMIHMLTDYPGLERLLGFGLREWIEKEKTSGRVKNIGFSYHGSSIDFKKIIDAYDWDFCMMQYNYIDETHQAGTSGLEYAHAKGLPVMIMEPLRGGKLAGGLPSRALDAFQAVHPDRSPAEWGLRWVWNHPEVTTVLSGMSDEKQVADNLRIASDAQPNTLSDAELAAYVTAVDAIRGATKANCTGCGYCMPCPAGVDIPRAFADYNDSAILSKTSIRFTYMLSSGALKKTTFASQCKRCGKCEKHCPQNIPIMNTLADATKFLEPFWVKPLSRVVRVFTTGRKA